MIERRPGIAPLQRSRLTEATILSLLIEQERSCNPDFELSQGSLTLEALRSYDGRVRRHSFAFLTDEHVARFPEILASPTALIRDAQASAHSGSTDAPRRNRVRFHEPSGSVAMTAGRGNRADLETESLPAAGRGGMARDNSGTQQERAAAHELEAANQRAAIGRSCMIIEHTVDTLLSFADDIWNGRFLWRSRASAV
eukprot:TRINITY_DN26677_c0_g1_i1.p1 TRINITY_DN26677_c0_g1~~TRINITY_DN26677_c0_g1_i1.p1  ORF type:complete len:198 (+),score=17.64 TRINITY_DN26677_c0_g1_i1:92-685(+)